ncbi:MAG TPA: PAS domain S-box protein [Opitutaceae bacterium]|nr:PAS domain S-box protein [Opitutaceae bacterium]
MNPAPGPDPSPARPPQLPAELMLSAIFDASDDMISMQNRDHVITAWNPSAERMLGYSAAEAIGQSCMMLVAPERQVQEEEILSRILRGERIAHFETVWMRKDGSRLEISVTVSPIRAPDGAVVGSSKVARDIGQRKRESEADSLLAAIVSSSDDAIVSKNLDGIITSWNEGARRMFGYAPEEIIGRPVLMLLPADRKDEEPRILDRLRRGERIDHFETVRVRKNGEHFPVSLTISPVKDAAGKVIGASKIARDITELKRVATEREQFLQGERAARAQAEHANRMKDEFLTTISHELRTPLNAIVGWAEVLKAIAPGHEEVLNGIEVIERNARIQAQLIDDLLDLGRISSGKMTLNVEPVDLAAVVREAIGSVQHAADLKHIVIRTVLSDPSGRLTGDVKRLRQVVWNLLANAIKFTPAHGRVTVTLARVGSQIALTVADNGRGIAAEFLPYVFERFRQADSSITRQHGGLGIGLALVKQLVELHAGTVRAESPGLGLGATFTVTLPLAVAHPERLTAGPESGSASAPPGGVDLGGVKVLAVDDDRDSLELLRRILAARNADIRTAASVAQALDIFREFHPDVVLSDIGMPDADGYDLIRRIRGLPRGESVPAAALTALARAEDRMRALQAGYQTHVAKPVAAAEIVAVVRSLASLRGTHRGGAERRLPPDGAPAADSPPDRN